VPRGMAARVPQMVAIQGSQLMGEPLGGPYHLMLEALWAFEVANVFLWSIRLHGNLWRLPMAIRSAFADLTPERMCSADPSARPLLEDGLKLVRRIEGRAPPDWLSWLGGPRGVFRCAKVLDDEGTLVLEEGLGDARLPYGRDILRIPASEHWTGTWRMLGRLARASWWLQSPRRPLQLRPPPPSPCALPLGGGCHARPTCLAWPVYPRVLVVPTPLGVDVGRLLPWGDPQAPLWRPFLSLFGKGRPSLCSKMDRDHLGEEENSGRLGRLRETRYGTRGPGKRADRNAKT